MQATKYKIYLLVYHTEAALQSIVIAAAMLFPCGGIYIDRNDPRGICRRKIDSYHKLLVA